MRKFSKKGLLTIALGALMFMAPIAVVPNSPETEPTLNQHISSNQTEQKVSTATRLFSIVPAVAYAQEGSSCSTFDFFCWYVNILEIILVQVTQLLAGVVALILDIMIHHSINSSSYRGAGFIEAGWEILRDFTNIVFIFSLLVIAFKLVVGAGASAVKKRLINTLVLAIIINFSLFFTYIIIDASNLLAYVFYNKIDAPQTEFSYNDEGIEYVPPNSQGTSNEGTSGQTQGEGGTYNSTGTEKSISLAIASKINPQDALNNLTGTQDTARLFVIFIVAAINIAFIYVFFSMVLVFLGRTLGLMVLAVLSPLAFASKAVGQEKLQYVGFDTWLKQLLGLAFMAPVFLFFIYIATLFSGIANNIGAPSADVGVIETTLNFSIPLLVTLSLIMLAKKVSTTLAGELGGMVASYAGKAAGVAVAASAVVATGGAAIAGGALRGLGAVAGKDSTGDKLFGGAGRRLQAQNFNFGQSRLGGAVSQVTGINMGAKLGNISYGRADTAVRGGANKMRAGISDLKTGRTPESVKNWQDSLDGSRDKLTGRRIENRQDKAAKVAEAEIKVAQFTDNPDGTRTFTGFVEENTSLQDSLKEREATLGQRKSKDAKIEKDAVDEKTRSIDLEIKALEAEAKQQSGLGTPAGISAAQTARETINTKKKEIRNIQESTLTGQITQIKTQIANAKNTARAEMLTEDIDKRGPMQNASLTISKNRRKERMKTQATRVGSGDIKSTPNVGGDAKAEE